LQAVVRQACASVTHSAAYGSKSRAGAAGAKAQREGRTQRWLAAAGAHASMASACRHARSAAAQPSPVIIAMLGWLGCLSGDVARCDAAAPPGAVKVWPRDYWSRSLTSGSYSMQGDAATEEDDQRTWNQEQASSFLAAIHQHGTSNWQKVRHVTISLHGDLRCISGGRRGHSI
jgi:hypothetical protein